MPVTATDAKNRFGQLLEQAQHAPVVIEKAGRRHSVVMSARLYDELVAARAPAGESEGAPPEHSAEGRAFYEKYKDWVDEQIAHFERHGIWNQEFRSW